MGFDKRSRNLTEQTQRFVVQPINMRVCCTCENREEDSKSVGFGLPPLRIHSDCDGEHCLSRAIWLIFSRRMQLLSQGSRSAIRALVVLASPNTPGKDHCRGASSPLRRTDCDAQKAYVEIEPSKARAFNSWQARRLCAFAIAGIDKLARNCPDS
jgi:hypothetical protein